jgi:hypothetical protein
MSDLSASFAGRSAVAAMSGVEIPTFVALTGHGGFVNVSGQSAGAKQSPGLLGRFEERHYECLAWKSIRVVPAWAYADGRQPSLTGNFILDRRVVVGFIALQVCESAGTAGYGVRVPFPADFDGFRAEVVGPFGLALDDEIPSGGIRGANGPARIHGKGGRDLMKADAGFCGDVGPDRVALVASRRCFGIKSHKDPEVLLGWGGDRSSLETGDRSLLLFGRRGRGRGSGMAPRGVM